MSDEEEVEYGNEDRGNYSCAKAVAFVMMVCGGTALALSLIYVDEPHSESFISILIGGVTMFTFGICFLCFSKSGGSSRYKTEEEDLAMMPVVTGVRPVPVGQNTLITNGQHQVNINIPNTSDLQTEHQDTSISWYPDTSSRTGNSRLPSNRYNLSELHMVDTDTNSDNSTSYFHNSPYDDLPPSYESVMRGMGKDIVVIPPPPPDN